jgi:hypothetical protein
MLLKLPLKISFPVKFDLPHSPGLRQKTPGYFTKIELGKAPKSNLVENLRCYFYSPAQLDLVQQARRLACSAASGSYWAAELSPQQNPQNRALFHLTCINLFKGITQALTKIARQQRLLLP